MFDVLMKKNVRYFQICVDKGSDIGPSQINRQLERIIAYYP